ncbi:MAG: SIMPL domain-containing protein [Bacteroidaceae bacterium]|nr:SIMPL domain-containing protein [Prevotellaceae bacterium]MDY5632123.1 SIMPL domain-containing protein [Bacteroidaceae bacterium]
MKQNNIVAASVLALGMIALGFVLRSAVLDFQRGNRIVTVKGLSEREVKADKITWPLTYKELGNDPAVMYDVLERKNQLVVAFLKQGGLKDEEISINPPTISDRQADNYSNGTVAYRFRATSIITVTSKDVDRVRQLMRRQGELMKQGVAILGEDWSTGSVNYEFTGLNEIKPEMMEEATKNALLTARKFTDSKGSLVIHKASQGQFSIEDRDANTPYIKRVRVVNTVDYVIK